VRKVFIPISVVGIVAVISAGTPAMAGDTINVVTTIGKSCTAPDNSIITLPNYNGTDRSASANIKFKCTKNTPFKIELFPSNSTVPSSKGTLKSPKNTTPIKYTVKVGTTPISTFSGRGNGLSAGAAEVGAKPEIHPTPNQDPEPGIYSDNIGIKVSY
jgi:spore coat protein U-like protein